MRSLLKIILMITTSQDTGLDGRRMNILRSDLLNFVRLWSRRLWSDKANGRDVLGPLKWFLPQPISFPRDLRLYRWHSMTRRSAKRMQSMAKMTTIRVSSSSIFARKALLRLASIITIPEPSPLVNVTSFISSKILQHTFLSTLLFHKLILACFL